jgi:hypothetical protein
MVRANEPPINFIENRASALFEVIVGVALAGVLYPIVLALVTAPFYFRSMTWPDAILSPILGALIGGTIATAFAFVFSFLLAVFASSVGRSIPPIVFGVLVGGMTGYFIACVPFMTVPQITITHFLAGPVMCMISGQIGGFCGGAGCLSRAINSGRRVERSCPKSVIRSRQFGLRELLIAMVWVSGLLAILKVLGLLETPRIVLLLATWVVLHAVTCFTGKKVVQAYNNARKRSVVVSSRPFSIPNAASTTE